MIHAQQISCEALKTTYRNVVLEDSSVGCCNNPAGVINAASCVADQESVTTLANKTDGLVSKYDDLLSLVKSGNVTIASNRPEHSFSPGVKGTITWDHMYMYIATDTDEWKRVKLEAFVTQPFDATTPSVRFPYSKMVIFGAREKVNDYWSVRPDAYSLDDTKFAGRVSDGPIYTDWLAYYMGSELLPEGSHRGGWNYANRYASFGWHISAGGLSANSLIGKEMYEDEYRIVKQTSGLRQVSYEDQVDWYLKDDQGADPKALFVIGFGTYYYTAQSRFQSAISNVDGVRSLVDTLVDAGANNIIVHDQFPDSPESKMHDIVMASITNNEERKQLNSIRQVKAYARSLEAFIYLKEIGPITYLTIDNMFYDGKRNLPTKEFHSIVARDLKHQMEGKVDVIPPVKYTWSADAVEVLNGIVAEGDEIDENSTAMANMKAYVTSLNIITAQESKDAILGAQWTSQTLYFIVPHMVKVEKIKPDTPKLVLRGVFDSEYRGSTSSSPDYISYMRQITSSAGNALLFTATEDIDSLDLYGVNIMNIGGNGISVSNPRGLYDDFDAYEWQFPKGLSAKAGENILVTRKRVMRDEDWFGPKSQCDFNFTRISPGKYDHFVQLSWSGDEVVQMYTPTMRGSGLFKQSFKTEFQQFSNLSIALSDDGNWWQGKAAVLTGDVTKHFDPSAWTTTPSVGRSGPPPMYPNFPLCGQAQRTEWLYKDFIPPPPPPPAPPSPPHPASPPPLDTPPALSIAMISGASAGSTAEDIASRTILLYAHEDVDDLSKFAFGVASAGNPANGGPEKRLEGSVQAGQYITLTRWNPTDIVNAPSYMPRYGPMPGTEEMTAQGLLGPHISVGSTIAQNGDDTVELLEQISPNAEEGNSYDGWTVIDRFGELGGPGQGTPWEYIDGYAKRIKGTRADRTFNLDHWKVVKNVFTNPAASAENYWETYYPGLNYDWPLPPMSITLVSGPLAGSGFEDGMSRVIILYAHENVADLSKYAIGVATNGDGTNGGPEFRMAGNVSQDQFITVRYASDETNPSSAPDFGLIPGAAELIAQDKMGPMQYMGGKLAINGNDVVELLYQTLPNGVVGNDYTGWIVQDVMGERGVDGTNTGWDYRDGCAKRIHGTRAKFDWNIDDWKFDTCSFTNPPSGTSNWNYYPGLNYTWA